MLIFDELNELREKILKSGYSKNGVSTFDAEEVEDEVLEYLVMTYVMGNEEASAQIDYEVLLTRDDAFSSIYKKTVGETFADRVKRYAEEGDLESIMRVAETEGVRNYNEAVQRTGNIASKGGLNILKKWVTRNDPLVRDTHNYLEGKTVPLNEEFVTYDGDSALYPGGFGLAENNVNCRCNIELVKQ